MQPKIVDVTIPLHKSPKGRTLRICSLPQGTLRAYLIRLGLNEGDHVVCSERLPGGTVVLQKNRQQIAIGVGLARQILVFVVTR